MNKSESIKELTSALAKSQIAFKPIKKTEKVDYQTTGGRKKYNYAPLSEVIEATRQALSDNGLAITQSTTLVEGNTILETLLSHSSGEWRLGELYVGKQDQSPQSEGSALTYKRRYGMSAMLCVASEDDDDGDNVIESRPKSQKKAELEISKETQSTDASEIVKELTSASVEPTGGVTNAQELMKWAYDISPEYTPSWIRKEMGFGTKIISDEMAIQAYNQLREK